MRTPDRIVSVLTGVCITLYFLFLAGEGVRAYFSPDDLMNLYVCWKRPAQELLKANFLFFSEFFRPMGAVFYRTLYAAAGFQPAPFHIACFAIALFNLYLTYCLVRRLTGSREIAALGTLISAYHARFADLYYNIGTVYDLLCFTFLYGAFLYYVRIREQGNRLSKLQAGVCCVLYVCALNSKEMAVTLPIFIAAYEWFYHSRISRWMVPILTLITVAFIAGKTTGQDRMTLNPAYHPDVSARNYFDAFQTYAGKLFYGEEGFTMRTGIGLLLLLVAIAWISKDRHLKLSCILITAGILPVAFITRRGGFVQYMPMVGWAMFGATMLAWARDAILPRKTPVFAGTVRWDQALLFLVAMLWLGRVHRSHYDPTWLSNPNDKLQPATERMRRLNPKLPHGARVLVLNDPFEMDESWQMKGLLQLIYDDHEMEVMTPKRMNPQPDTAEIATFGYVFEYTDTSVAQLKPKIDP